MAIAEKEAVVGASYIPWLLFAAYQFVVPVDHTTEHTAALQVDVLTDQTDSIRETGDQTISSAH